MRTAVVGVNGSQSLDDVGASTHRSGDDSLLAQARTDRSLAGDNDLLAEVSLLIQVIVVTVDRVQTLDCRSVHEHADELLCGALDSRHHDLPAAPGEPLCQLHSPEA